MKKTESIITQAELMANDEVAAAADFAAKNRRHTRRFRLFGGAAALVVFITTYMLILPAITMTGTPTCGLEEHTHTDDCYTTETVLTCGLEETEGHTHTDTCYDADGNLICGLEESEGHTHTDACYTTEEVLTCTIPEHTHSSNCYSETEDAAEVAAVDSSADAETSEEEAATAEASSTLTAEADGYTVTAEYPADALPENAALQVTVIDPKSEEFAARAAEYETATGKTMDFLLDISFYVDGEEVEPTAPVQITIRFDDPHIKQESDLSMVHFKDNDVPEAVDSDPVDNCETSFSLDSFSEVGGSISGTQYSSDLYDFVESVSMTDSAGNPVTDTVYLGENYTIKLKFAENNNAGSERQFQYDEDGYLTYQLDASRLNIKAVTNAPLTATQDIDIGTLHIAKGDTFGYYSLDSNGKLTVKLNDYSYTDDDGTVYTNRNLIDAAQNVAFYVDLNATVNADSSEQSWSVPFSDDITIGGTISEDGKLSAEKTAGNYDAKNHTIIYTVKVTCTEGRVKGPFSFTDTSTLTTADKTVHSGWTEIQDDSIKYYTLDGNTELTADELPSVLDAGEGYQIKYNLHIKDEFYDEIAASASDNTNSSVSSNFTVKNAITVTGNSDSDNPPDATDDASKSTTVTLMQKKYQTVKIDDTEVLYWTVTVGDGSKLLTGDGEQAPVAFTDTLGSGLSFFTASTTYPYMKVTVTNEDGTTSTYNYYYDTAQANYVTLSDDGKTASLQLPVGKKYVINYYTTVEEGETDDGAYNNQAVASIYPNPIQVITGAPSSIGIPGVSKELTGTDGDYYTYTVTVDMPQAMYQKAFFLSDSLIFKYTNTSGTQEYKPHVDMSSVAEPGNLTVTVTHDDGTVTTLSQYSGSGSAEDTYTLAFYTSQNNGAFQLRFGSTKASYSTGTPNASTEVWPYDEHTVLTVTYRVSKYAKVQNGLSLPENLNWGRPMLNEAQAKYGTDTVTVDNYYYERQQMTKEASQDDGIIEYKVRFANKRSTSTDSDEWEAFLPESFTGAYLSDTYDSQLMLSPGSYIYAYTYDITNGGNAVSSFSCPVSAVSTSGNSFTAMWSDFTKISDKTSSSSTDLQTFMQENYNKYYVVFYYYMEPVNQSLDNLASGLTVTNSAKCGFTKNPDNNPEQIETSEVTNVFDYETQVLEKSGTQATTGGNEITYTIDVNPDGLQLTNDGSAIQVVDQMGPNLILYQDSIRFAGSLEASAGEQQFSALQSMNYETFKAMLLAQDSTWTDEEMEEYWEYIQEEIQASTSVSNACSYVYNESTNTITFTVPGDQYVQITYTARVDTDTTGAVSVSNTASINGYSSYSSGGSTTFDISDTTGGGSASTQYLIVQKQDAENYAPMDGVTFDLYGPANSSRQGTPPNGAAATVTNAAGETLYYYTSYTTAQNSSTLDGVFLITDAMMSNNGHYALVERNTPEGYIAQSEPISFTWNADDTHTIDGVKNYTNRESMTILNERYHYSLPATGGIGTDLFTTGGAAAMLAAPVIGFSLRRRRERRAER